MKEERHRKIATVLVIGVIVGWFALLFSVPLIAIGLLLLALVIKK